MIFLLFRAAGFDLPCTMPAFAAFGSGWLDSTLHLWRGHPGSFFCYFLTDLSGEKAEFEASLIFGLIPHTSYTTFSWDSSSGFPLLLPFLKKSKTGIPPEHHASVLE